jgi:hypothetical protein
VNKELPGRRWSGSEYMLEGVYDWNKVGLKKSWYKGHTLNLSKGNTGIDLDFIHTI